MADSKIRVCRDDDMKLNEICEVYSGYALKAFNDAEDGFPVIKIGNIFMDGTLNLEECQYTTDGVNEKYYSQRGDIYIALSGATTGKIGIMDASEKYVINQRVGIVRQKSDDIPQEYIKYFLLRQTDRILQEAAGCAQPNISPRQIAEYVVPDTSQEKMQEICEVLDRIKKIIDSRKVQISALDNLIKARFVEMFGDPIRNTQNRPTTEFINVVKMQRGFDLPVQDRQQDGEIPVYGSNGALDYHNVAKIHGGVITGRSGTIGKVFYTEGDFWPLNTSLFSADTHGNNVIYLGYLLQLFDLTRFVEGTGVPTLNRNMFHNKQIIDVPIDEQRVFAAFVNEIDKSKLQKFSAA